MADDKKAAKAVTKSILDDIKALAPEGFEGQVDSTLRSGQLTPLYLPKFAVEHNFPVVMGWLEKVHIMPTQIRGTARRGEEAEEFVPFNLMVRDLKAPTKGVRRTKMGELGPEDICDVAAGERILLPITGQLRVDQDLQQVIRDVANVYWIVARVAGFKKVNNMSPMADWEIIWLRDQKKQMIKKARTTEYALPLHYIQSVASGELIVSVTKGELVGRLALEDGGIGQSSQLDGAGSNELLPASTPS